MSARWRTTLGAALAMAETGVLRPLGPRTAVRVLGRLRALGTSPALLAGAAAVRWPDHVALVDDAGSLTYRELDEQAASLAHALGTRHGLGPGAGLAVMCRNHRGLVLGLLAAGRLHADVVLVNTELPAAQLGPTLQRHAPRVLLHDAEFADKLEDLDAGTVAVTAWSGSAPNDLDELVRTPVPAGHRWSRPPAQAANLVILTSGTTGAPKGVPRRPSSGDLLGTAASLMHRLRLRVNGTVVVCPPAFHGLGLVTMLLGLMTGSTVVMRSRFDPEQAACDVSDHPGATLVVVPIMLQRLLGVPGVEDLLAGAGAVLSGGSALSAATADEVLTRIGPVLHNGYGSSEVGVAAVATPDDLAAVPGTVGRPVLGTSVRVVDDEGRDVPVGASGRIVVASPLAFEQYSGGGGKALVAGHVETGDVGSMDPAGRLVVSGRADDMIVSGGENVFPQPVEDALLRRPDVLEAAVVGVPDPEFGQRLEAFVVARHDLDPVRVREDLRAELTRYELPRGITVVPRLPRTASGKVLRARLVDPATTPAKEDA